LPLAMNLALYCSVAEAATIAAVSRGYLHHLIKTGRVKATKVGSAYVVLRSSVAAFERQPGRGRPRKAPAPPKKRTRRRRK
jgi:excisionase family DNA binding protein